MVKLGTFLVLAMAFTIIAVAVDTAPACAQASCAWCKKVRDDSGYWSQIEEYVSEHTQAEFSHGICPDCREKMLPRAAGPPPPA